MANNVKLILKEKVHVTSPFVYVKDIANIVTDKKSLSDKLGDTLLIKSPRVGYVKKIKKPELKRLLGDESYFNKKNVLLIFPESQEINIRLKAVSYDYRKISKVAWNELEEFLKKKSKRMKIATGIKDDVFLPYQGLSFKTRINSKVISPRMCVWVDVYHKDVFYRALPVWFDVAIYEPVFVASEYLENKQVITESDFIVMERNVAKYYGDHVKVSEKGFERLMLHNIEAGETLINKSIKKVPAVIAGKLVDVIVNEGNVSIQMKAIARKDAEIGQTVNVRSSQGNLIKTKVVGKQQVEVI